MKQYFKFWYFLYTKSVTWNNWISKYSQTYWVFLCFFFGKWLSKPTFLELLVVE